MNYYTAAQEKALETASCPLRLRAQCFPTMRADPQPDQTPLQNVDMSWHDGIGQPCHSGWPRAGVDLLIEIATLALTRIRLSGLCRPMM
jgi:hypothetical protein